MKDRSPRMLGMYVHTHWSYNHPYCARTWTREDWHRYLRALQSLGYGTVMIWPQLDTMPMPPTASDEAFLSKFRGIIEFAHGVGFKVLIVLTPNIVASPAASTFTFERRDYWKSEAKVDPNDRGAVERMLTTRRHHLEPLAAADGIAIIDSDPGGWPGSPAEQFVDLFVAQANAARRLNPSAEIWYWAWQGWPVGQRVQTFLDTLSLLRSRADFPWQILSCHDTHLEGTDLLDLGKRRGFFPYNMVEFEPSFPMINCRLRWFRDEMKRYDPALYPLGLLVNSQTHCFQAPYAYLVSHYAGGGTLATEKFMSFGEKLVAGEAGEILSNAFVHLEAEQPEVITMRFWARKLRIAAEGDCTPGPLAGLIFMPPRQYLLDVADNLDLRADFIELRTAVDSGRNVKKVLRELLAHIRPYQKRIGYDHAWHDQPLRQNLLFPLRRLEDPALDHALTGDPSGANGYLPPLFDAIEGFARE